MSSATFRSRQELKNFQAVFNLAKTNKKTQFLYFKNNYFYATNSYILAKVPFKLDTTPFYIDINNLKITNSIINFSVWVDDGKKLILENSKNPIEKIIFEKKEIVNTNERSHDHHVQVIENYFLPKEEIRKLCFSLDPQVLSQVSELCTKFDLQKVPLIFIKDSSLTMLKVEDKDSGIFIIFTTLKDND